ncbi:hypothetical protein ACRRTK_022980 [Alexandromys fortis]
MDTERAPFSFEYLEGKTGLDIDTLKRLDSPGCNRQRLTSYLETTSAKKQRRQQHKDNSPEATYRAGSELPWANRDTLAFLRIPLQRVAQSLNTKMDVANPAQVFGPTIVAPAMPSPDPVTVFQDIKCQLEVVEPLLSLPLESWNQFMMAEKSICTRQ